MKMIIAIIRPNKLNSVTEALSKEGFPALTEISVRGRGKQKGIRINDMLYDKLPKEMLIIVAKNEDVEKIVSIISTTGKTGNIGDGKIFILNVEENITIRTGERIKE
ncbi:MAG: P-II family nitrogen regulator [Brevinematales bacterium]|nr:P-II family nitrogen regulator [Brevinematales bacterium]